MLESTYWNGGLRDKQLPIDTQKCDAIAQNIDAAIEIIKTNVFPFQGL